MADASGSDASFEREKWQADLLIRTREVAVKEREQDVRQKEVDAKLDELRRSRWANPLVLALLAAAIAATGNAVVAYINGVAQRYQDERHSKAENTLQINKADADRQLEDRKSEAARILEVVRTTDPDKAAVNLSFLLDAGLIADPYRRQAIKSYLDNRKPGEGVAITATEPLYQWEWKTDVQTHCELKAEASIPVVLSAIEKTFWDNYPRLINTKRKTESVEVYQMQNIQQRLSKYQRCWLAYISFYKPFTFYHRSACSYKGRIVQRRSLVAAVF